MIIELDQPIDEEVLKDLSKMEDMTTIYLPKLY